MTAASEIKITHVPGPVERAVALINSDLSCHIIVKQLALQSGTNECTLKKAFRQVLHTSIYQYLLRSRMQKAQELLITTVHKEKDIAMECGYESLAGFVTSFKRYHGLTPSETRKHYYGNH